MVFAPDLRTRLLLLFPPVSSGRPEYQGEGEIPKPELKAQETKERTGEAVLAGGEGSNRGLEGEKKSLFERLEILGRKIGEHALRTPVPKTNE